jgi:hypothetical protein
MTFLFTVPASLYRNKRGKTTKSVTNLINNTITNLQNKGTVNRIVLAMLLFPSGSSSSSTRSASVFLAVAPPSVSSLSLDSSAVIERNVGRLHGEVNRFDLTVGILEVLVVGTYFEIVKDQLSGRSKNPSRTRNNVDWRGIISDIIAMEMALGLREIEMINIGLLVLDDT